MLNITWFMEFWVHNFFPDFYALSLGIYYGTMYIEAVVAFIDMFNADESQDLSRKSSKLLIMFMSYSCLAI